MKPANTAAETVLRLQQDSSFYLEQVEKNTELIGQLTPLAEWTEPVEAVEEMSADSLKID
jgi:hypothetical protein